jgi:hypothetical protein
MVRRFREGLWWSGLRRVSVFGSCLGVPSLSFLFSRFILSVRCCKRMNNATLSMTGLFQICESILNPLLIACFQESSGFLDVDLFL